MTSFTDIWNATFNTTPANIDAISAGAGKIRQLKVAIQERLGVDHSTAGDANDGAHKKVTLLEQASNPTTVANTGYLYTKDVAGKTEVFYKDSSGSIIQLSSGGKLGLAGQAIVGVLTGNVTGDVTGNVTGNVSGDVTGSISGGTVSGTTATGTGGSSAVAGSASTTGTGTYGSSSSGIGVHGITSTNYGVRGQATAGGLGVYGTSTSGVGVQGAGATYDFYASGSGTNYGPFTGGHDGLMQKNIIVHPGDIVVDTNIIYHAGISNTIAQNDISSYPADKRAVGVFNWRHALLEDARPAALTNFEDFVNIIPVYDRISFNALGEGLINVCKEGGNIEAGDYIHTSSIPGKGMRQADDIYHNYTVARARESVSWDAEDDSIKQIACIYLCG